MATLPRSIFGSHSQDLQSAFKFLSRHNRFPITANRLGNNACFGTHDPACIEPVVKALRQGILSCSSNVILDFDKRSATTITIAFGMQCLADLCQGVLPCQEQVPGFTPDVQQMCPICRCGRQHSISRLCISMKMSLLTGNSGQWISSGCSLRTRSSLCCTCLRTWRLACINLAI